MPDFDVSRGWVILVPPGLAQVNKAAEDLSRYIGLLAGMKPGLSPKPSVSSKPFAPLITGDDPAPAGPVIILNSDCGDPDENGFSWRVGDGRIEIFGESGRGLCNGIYSFLAALGISWPFPGEEKLPAPTMINSANVVQVSPVFTLTSGGMHEPSRRKERNSAVSRRFIPAGKKTANFILRNGEAFAAWAARRRYDAIIYPLTAFASESKRKKLRQLKQFAAEYGIALEAGGHELSSLVPRKYFFLHRDYFRMVEGRRKKEHHFCPTSPGAIRLAGREAEKLFRAAGEVKVFHLWPDKGAERVWCSCPTCRAFSPQEQNRIGVNTAADILASVDPEAHITFFEQSGEEINIPLRKNLVRMEKLPEEKELRNSGNY